MQKKKIVGTAPESLHARRIRSDATTRAKNITHTQPKEGQWKDEERYRQVVRLP
jgi:hypothetical protein